MTSLDPVAGRTRPDLRLVRGDQPLSGHVVVIGGGIAGLAAAHAIARDGGPGVRVTVVEGARRLGGKVHASDLAGLPLDEGAESMQATRPEAVGLTRAVGLDPDLVFPAVSGAGIWTRGRIRPMPPSVMGVPTDLRALTASGVLPLAAVLRLPLEPMRAATPFERDVSVGAFVEARLGREVVDTLVEPLLGGVYAGRADALSLRSTVPTLYREVRSERSLLRAASRVARAGSRESGARRGPVFAGISGGLGRLPEAVAADLRGRGAAMLLGRSVRSLHRNGDGWRVVVGAAPDQQVLEADAVVLAVPAYSASGLLDHIVPSVSADLGLVKHASMAVVGLAYRVSDIPGTLAGTGFLVPPAEGRSVKGVTYSSSKWGWLATMARTAHSDGLAVIRCSLGRLGDDAVLQREDAEITALAHADLGEAIGVQGPPVATRVTRWHDALPQYAVGHADRIDRVRTRVADVPGLEVCGAAYDGVGVAAVVGSARTAANGVLRHLRERAQLQHG